MSPKGRRGYGIPSRSVFHVAEMHALTQQAAPPEQTPVPMKRKTPSKLALALEIGADPDRAQAVLTALCRDNYARTSQSS